MVKKTATKKPAVKKAAAAKVATKTTPPVARATVIPSVDALIGWIGTGDNRANPHREGSVEREAAELLRKYNGKSIEAYLKAGGTRHVLRLNLRRGYIKLG